MATQLGIFAKHWTPGRVKTRLAQTVGDAAAAEIAKAFVETLLQRMVGIADRSVIGFAPPDARGAFAGLAGDDWRTVPQVDGDLGARMRAYFEKAFASGAQRVVLIGADSPDIPLEYVRSTFEMLDRFQLVLGPADDGGYYLIGARDEPPPIFDDMPWSTPRLQRATEARLRKLGWRFGHDWMRAPLWYDVDTTTDLERLRARMVEPLYDQPLKNLKSKLASILNSAGG